MNWNWKDPLLLCTIARNARSRTAPALPGGTLFLPSTLENAVPVLSLLTCAAACFSAAWDAERCVCVFIRRVCVYTYMYTRRRAPTRLPAPWVRTAAAAARRHSCAVPARRFPGPLSARAAGGDGGGGLACYAPPSLPPSCHGRQVHGGHLRAFPSPQLSKSGTPWYQTDSKTPTVFSLIQKLQRHFSIYQFSP